MELVEARCGLLPTPIVGMSQTSSAGPNTAVVQLTSRVAKKAMIQCVGSVLLDR